MPAPSSIGVHDDFTPCESCITLMIRKNISELKLKINVSLSFPSVVPNLWASHEEFPTGQQMVDGLVIQVLGRHDDLHHLLHQVESDLLQVDVRAVLH